MSALAAVQNIQPLLNTLESVGAPFQWAVVVASVFLAVLALVPALAPWRRWALGGVTALLLFGEALLAWAHFELYQFTPVIDPSTGIVQGHVAVSLWVEGERLYVWALTVAILGVLMRRERERLLPGVMLSVAAIATLGVLSGNPFTNPLPNFLGQYAGYVQAMSVGGVAAQGAFQGMEQTRQFFYNAWFMWVHPPLLYFSYGAFTVSFVSAIQMVVYRHSRFETVSYRWARLGYLALTVGMLLGFPWALEAWNGSAWWWSGFVNMSIMMWVLYTAYLHARLYLRRQHMWRVVAALALLSFAVLILTYVATYVVPGAHSYAAAWAPGIRELASAARGVVRGGA